MELSKEELVQKMLAGNMINELGKEFLLSLGLEWDISKESYEFRLRMAKKGYALDELVFDSEITVRLEVAKHGYALEQLINDSAWEVRKEVARQGFGLELLVDDVEEIVRAEVARQGFGLDKLSNDSSDWVKEVALEMQKSSKTYGKVC